MKTDLQILRDARALIARGWTQNTYSVDSQNMPAPLQEHGASKFCLVGAIYKAVGCWEAPFGVVQAIGDALGMYRPGTGALVDWNDQPGRTQQEVIEALDVAISIVERAIAVGEQTAPRVSDVELMM